MAFSSKYLSTAFSVAFLGQLPKTVSTWYSETMQLMQQKFLMSAAHIILDTVESYNHTN